MIITNNIVCINDILIIKKSGLDKTLAFLIVLTPILQHYRGFFTDISSELLILIFPVVFCKLYLNSTWYIKNVIPLMIYGIFVIIGNGFSIFECGREGLLIIYYIAVANNVIKANDIVNFASMIALWASIVIIIQYFCYYFLDFHLQIVPTSLLKESAEQWIMLAKTGIISVTGSEMRFYRPSAFFLEPSHFAIYCFPSVAILLLSKKLTFNYLVRAILISIGIFLSTSGMGIAIVSGIWILYGVIYISRQDLIREKKIFTSKNLAFIIILVVIFCVLYFCVDVFNASVNRIFVNPTGKMSAIEGRTSTGIRSIQGLSGIEFWLGKAEPGPVSQWNMPGFFYNFYILGFIGVILSYIFCVISLFRVKRGFFWVTVIVIVLSFFTVHTYAAFYRMYFNCIILEGYREVASSYKNNFRIRKELCVAKKRK